MSSQYQRGTSSGCVALTRYAPTVPCANMRAHSDIKNILIFEKHDDFLRRLSPSSMSPPLRSDSRCFFTCILPYFYPHSTARKRNTQGHSLVQCFAFPLKATFAVLLCRGLFLNSLIFNAVLTPDKLGNTHPNSTRLCWSSAPKHCLPVDALEHVNSLKVFVKAQKNRGRVILCHIACFPRRVLWV